jgi:pyrroloquinoline quinone biosynthesis protein B
MWVRVLGSAAGGAFPQWNCGCPGCRAARDGSRPTLPRTQSSIAVSPDYRRWFLLNASPDLRSQLAACPALWPGEERATPLSAVLLTDAEIDHTLGLLLLREGRGVELHATAAARETLCSGTGLLRTLEAYCPVDCREVVPGREVALGGGLSYRAFDVSPDKKPRFGGGPREGQVVGYRLHDEHTGTALTYLPGLQELTPRVRAQLEGCGCLLVDGTCWRDDELIQLGLGAKTAHEMGHLAISGPGGSLEALSAVPIQRKIYIHINNTNPILLEDSPERRAVDERGVEVATDGLEVEV